MKLAIPIAFVVLLPVLVLAMQSALHRGPATTATGQSTAPPAVVSPDQPVTDQLVVSYGYDSAPGGDVVRAQITRLLTSGKAQWTIRRIVGEKEGESNDCYAITGLTEQSRQSLIDEATKIAATWSGVGARWTERCPEGLMLSDAPVAWSTPPRGQTQHIANIRADRKGMTWGVVKPVTSEGVIAVSCHGMPQPGGRGCEGYVGDTDCSTSLPLLCLNVDGRQRPQDLKVWFYSGWAAGRVALTEPVPGNSFQTRADADALCTRQFGHGWRVAEHHDGIVDDQGSHGGWGFFANGDLPSTSRFWVAINDTAAVCWAPERGSGISR